MDDKQFNDALTAAGEWFFLTQFDIIQNWSGDKNDLIEKLFKRGFDSKITGTKTRVNSCIRIIDAGLAKDALEKIKNSRTVNKMHPDACEIADRLIKSL